MNIKPLPKTPHIPTTLSDGDSFVKALYKSLTEAFSTINSILACLQADSWRSPTLLNSWADYGSGYASAGYMLDAQGFVHLQGAVRSGNGTIFTLPPGYRPAYTVAEVGMSASNTPCHIGIATNGSVTVEGQSNAFVALDGISFKAAT